MYGQGAWFEVCGLGCIASRCNSDEMRRVRARSGMSGLAASAGVEQGDFISLVPATRTIIHQEGRQRANNMISQNRL